MGCILTALAVGVYLFSPWFEGVRPALYRPEPPDFADYYPTATPIGTPAPSYTERMSSWLAQLVEAQKIYVEVRRTVRTNADGSQTSFNVGAAIWGHVCWEYGEAEQATEHGGALPSTRTYVARACGSLTQSTGIMQRAFEEGREADYIRGLGLVERGFDDVGYAISAFRDNR